jgi:cytoskeletal protein CcmA (bactofilin family)
LAQGAKKVNFFKKHSLALGLIREDTIYSGVETAPQGVLVVPRGAFIEGGLRTNLSLVVAGDFHGDLEIEGVGQLTVVEGGVVHDGAISANTIVIHGCGKNVALDGDRISITADGSLEGDNQVAYAKLFVDSDADVSGSFTKKSADDQIPVTQEQLPWQTPLPEPQPLLQPQQQSFLQPPFQQPSWMQGGQGNLS